MPKSPFVDFFSPEWTLCHTHLGQPFLSGPGHVTAEFDDDVLVVSGLTSEGQDARVSRDLLGQLWAAHVAYCEADAAGIMAKVRRPGGEA